MLICGAIGRIPHFRQKENNPHFLDAGWELLSKAVADAVRSTFRALPAANVADVGADAQGPSSVGAQLRRPGRSSRVGIELSPP